MTDKEILEKVYERLKDRYHSPEQKMFGTVSFIEKEWQKRDEEETVQQYNRNREVKDHITDVSEIECALSESDQSGYLHEAKKHTPINREN